MRSGLDGIIVGLAFMVALGVVAVAGATSASLHTWSGGEATPCPAASPAASPVGTASPAVAPAATAIASPTACGRVITVTASAYAFTPNVFTLKVGQPATFVVHSTDIFHTFTIKQSKRSTTNVLSADVLPQQTARVVWTPKQPGDYYLYCIPHQALGMTGTIHVVP